MVKNCLIDFLTDAKQKKLINMIQNREETFEAGLEAYRKLFMVEMKQSIRNCHGNWDENQQEDTSDVSEIDEPEKNEVSKYDFYREEECQFPDACSTIYRILSGIKDKQIEKFFEGIQYCYICWIDSRTSIALETFETLLKEYGLIYEGSYDKDDELLVQNLSERVFFRGRVTNEFLGKMDMFHVPYNKRYNMRNERFSLTGQPSLYLGNSIADIIEELGLDIDDEESMHCLKISSFEFSEKKKEKKIFDLRCNICKDMRNVMHPSFSEKKFFRNILSIICSFQKRKGLEGYAFKEEYVIPQMLAQVLKRNYYDGICYYSTKRFYKYHLEADSPKVIESEINMNYRENIALFTKIDRKEKEFYDKDLRASLEISMPLGIRNIKESSEEELRNIHRSIGKHHQGINREFQKKADSIMSFYSSTFSKLEFDNKLYIETDFGKLHLQLLIGIINRLLVENEISDAEYYEEAKQNQEMEIEQIQCCDIFGKNTGLENSKEIHQYGKLHKGQIIFVIKRSEKVQEIQVAMWKKVDRAFLYGHQGSVEEQLAKHGFLVERDKERIGAFVYHDVSTTEWPQTRFSLKTNFEYVEVFLSEVVDGDETNDDFEWCSLEELKYELTISYQKFSKVYQQALPILLNYFYNIE